MRLFPRTDAAAQERAENVATIRAIPPSAFSADAHLAELARAALIARAAAGQDCYAYQPASSDRDRWVIWLRSGDPSHDDRMAPAEWTARYLAEGSRYHA